MHFQETKKYAKKIFDNLLLDVADKTDNENDFFEFYIYLRGNINEMLNNQNEFDRTYRITKHELNERKSLRKINPSKLNINPNNFSVKINNHGLQKSLFKYANSSTEILQIIKRYVKPGDSVQLLSGSRLYRYKVLTDGKYKKI